MPTRTSLQSRPRRVRRGRRGWAPLVIPVLAMTAAAACGDDDGAENGSATTEVVAGTTDPSEPEPTAPEATGPGSDTGEPAPEDPSDGPVPPDPSAIPEAAAPNGLGAVVLPDDPDGVVDLLAALPAELLGGERELENVAPGRIAATFTVAGRRCSDVGVQAFDLTASDGGFPENWRAEDLVALFASGADWDVEAAGRDESRYWVTFTTSCGEVGMEQDELVSSAAFGDEGSSWVFVVAAPDAAGRDELLTAFADAAVTVEQSTGAPASADQLAVEAALLTVDDLGDDWVALPRLPSDDTFDDVGTEALAQEPQCAGTLTLADERGVSVFELIDSLAHEPLARAESPTFTSRLDGQSEIEHTISLFATDDEAVAGISAVRDAGWLDCLIASVDDLMAAVFMEQGIDASVTDYVATQRDLALGDDSLAASFELLLTAADGSEIRFRLDLSVVVMGRATSAVSVFGTADVIDDATIEELIAVAADRIASLEG